jgi:hypothetical protein
MNHHLQQAHNIIHANLLNDIEYRVQWFMQLGKAVAEQVVKTFPEVSQETMVELTDGICDNVLKQVFGIELSAEVTRKTIKSIRNN